MADLIPLNSRRSPKIHEGPLDPLDTQSAGRSPTSTEFAGLREYVAIVLRHPWIVLGVVALSTGYTLNSVSKMLPQYQSGSTVRLVDARRSIAGDMSGVQSTESPFSYSVDPIESQLQVLRSDAVASVAVELKGLRLVPTNGSAAIDVVTDIRVSEPPSTEKITLEFLPAGYRMISNGKFVTSPYASAANLDGVHLAVARKPDIAKADFAVLSQEAAVSHALSGFSPSQRGKTDILDLSFVGADPYETKRLANAIAEAFQVQNASNAQQLSKRRRVFLEGQLRQTDSLLAQASARYSAFRSGRQVFSSAARAGAQESNLMDIDTRRAELDAEKQTYQALLARASAAKSENLGSNLRALVSSPGIAGNPVVQQLYNQLSAYESTRDSLINSGAASTNPDLLAVTSLIPATSEKMMDAVRSQIQSIDARVTALDRLRTAGASRISAAPAADAEEQELSAQVQTIRNTVAQLESELQRARMSEAVEAGQVQIVQLAKYPGYQLPTGKSRKLTMGLIVGLMLGFGAAILADTMDSSIRRRSDIERILGVPSLAILPSLEPLSKIEANLPGALRKLAIASRNRNDPHQDLVTVTAPRSAGAEAIRTLRTNLMFSQSLKSMRTLVVTSASPGEGKTTTASNLAAAFAQQGLRVLLVDCDLRRARLHRTFGIPREPGVSDLVLGYATEDAVTRVTEVRGLYVMPSGKLPPNPAELLGSDQTKKTLAILTEGYDLIVIDTPPLLAASDAAILSTISNGVIMVLRAGTTESAAAQQSLQQLTSVGARVIGAVLNDPDTQVPKYGAYYKYDYSAVES